GGAAVIAVAGGVDQVEAAVAVLDLRHAAVDRMHPRLFLLVAIGNGVATLDLAHALDRPAGMQQRLEQRGLADAGVSGERDVADAFRGIRHDATLPCRAWPHGMNGAA